MYHSDAIDADSIIEDCFNYVYVCPSENLYVMGTMGLSDARSCCKNPL